MVVTNDEKLAERMRVLRVQGGKPKYYHRVIGGNFRLDTLQTAVLNVKLPYLDRWRALRQKHAELYERLFGELKVESEFGVRLPHATYESKRIRTEIYYPVPLHKQKCLQTLGHKDGD